MAKIIGHRGAAGLALENSRASLRSAIASGVDAIEFDTRLTFDDKLVVMHDPKTSRVADDKVRVSQKTLAELQALNLHNGESILSLDEALDIIGGFPVFIELKDPGSVDELLLVLGRHPKAKASIVSFQHSELREIHRALPHVQTFVLEHFAPVDIVHSARNMHATGIGLNKWLMNPLTFRLTRRYNLEIYVYTVNNLYLARFLRFLYPGIHLCTDRPERLALLKASK